MGFKHKMHQFYETIEKMMSELKEFHGIFNKNASYFHFCTTQKNKQYHLLTFCFKTMKILVFFLCSLKCLDIFLSSNFQILKRKFHNYQYFNCNLYTTKGNQVWLKFTILDTNWYVPFHMFSYGRNSQNKRI